MMIKIMIMMIMMPTCADNDEDCGDNDDGDADSLGETDAHDDRSR